MEVIFNGDLLVMKIKIIYLILSPLVICYFRLILIFDLDHFLCDLPYLCVRPSIVHLALKVYANLLAISTLSQRGTRRGSAGGIGG